MTADGDDEVELWQLSRRLLDAIDQRDWESYTELCDPSLTAFEPEAVGHLVEGMAFHEFYFRMSDDGRPRRSTISQPSIRLMGDVALITYVRLTQRETRDGGSTTVAGEETRLWWKRDGRWRHMHFHRSKCGDVQL